MRKDDARRFWWFELKFTSKNIYSNTVEPTAQLADEMIAEIEELMLYAECCKQKLTEV